MEKPIAIYIHGFGSKYDPESNKIKSLNKIFNVHGITLDYTKSYNSIIKELKEFNSKVLADIIIGTSLGGFYANQLGVLIKEPFVSINPSIEPKITLKKYIGKGIDYNNKPYELNESTVNEYPEFINSAYGLILLDKDDDVIDPNRTIELYKDTYRIVSFNGGSHRFEHIEESLNPILKFYESVFIPE
jgi:predicted esterase YcpF (UPF0227 family)